MSISVLGAFSIVAAVTAVTKVARGVVVATGDLIRGEFNQAAYTAAGAVMSPITDAVIGVGRLVQDIGDAGAALSDRLRSIDEARDEARDAA